MKLMSPSQMDAICKAYTHTDKPVREIARKFHISDALIYDILTERKIPRRGKAFAIHASRHRMGKRNSFEHVFIHTKDKTIVEARELELAKTILRRRGSVVFNATVDGSGPKGFVKCDGQLFTVEQIIERANA